LSTEGCELAAAGPLAQSEEGEGKKKRGEKKVTG